MALHNFIRECDLEDPHFEEDVEDDSPHPTYDNTDGTGDDVDMNVFRDAIAAAMISWFSLEISCIYYLCTQCLEISVGTSLVIFMILIYLIK